jgi:hypothetical protein
MSGRETGFDQRDREAAYNFAVAAKEASVRRVIYLGGLAVAGANVSLHRKSRHNTGAVLRKYGRCCDLSIAPTPGLSGVICPKGMNACFLRRYAQQLNVRTPLDVGRHQEMGHEIITAVR